MIKAGIIGATGYVGQELVRILCAHGQVELHSLTSQSYVDKKYNQIYRNFSKFVEQECNPENIEAIANECDVIFIALPHGMASEKVTSNILDKAKVIDLGADFRIEDKNKYESWYSVKHHGEEILKEAAYGLCEWNRAKIKESRLIANPGCYATCSILSLLPLIKENVIVESSIIVDAKSGVTGAGRALNVDTHFTECNESIKAYKIATHRHTPEIEQEFNRLSKTDLKILFTPHLIPMNRGILVTAYATLKNDQNYQDILSIYEKYYKNEYFIRLFEKGAFPETRWVKGSNFCDIGFEIDERTNRIVVIGAIDNTVKGAAGQAVQNMNILFGMNERLGLTNIPIFPA